MVRGRRQARRLAGAARRRLRIRLQRMPYGWRLRSKPSADGVIEQFERGVVAGWVATREPAVRVALFANDLQVAAAWASDPVPDREDAKAFQLRLRDLWDYVGRGDMLTVRVDDAIVPIAGHGRSLAATGTPRRPLRELRRRLARGYVFGQGGRLQVSKKLDEKWQAQVTGLYTTVRSLVSERFGHDVFLVYGTLLGAVREGGVIGHDVDFDCAFVSPHSAGAEAAKDLRDIALFLIDRGFDVECRWTALHLHDAVDPSVRIDLFHLFFDEHGELAAPFGVAGTTVITREQWPGMKEIEFCGRPALVPINDEAFAEHLYGATWRLPKPGFDWRRDRTKRDRRGVLPASVVTEVLWENAYAHRHAQPDASPFALAVLARDDLPRTVVDIGCGDGRDTVAFAEHGLRAVGLDRSPRGIRLAEQRGSRASFESCDIATPGFGRRLAEVVAETDEPALFYLRFVVHAVDVKTEDSLLTALAEAARPGDLVAAEFRSDADEALPKASGKHYRRFVPGPAFDAKLVRAGFDVVDTADGTGLSPIPAEDPYLHRVVARRRP